MASFSIVTIQPVGYEHVSAFLDVKLLLYYSLQDLGHEVTLSTNHIPEGSTPIVFGAHLIDSSSFVELPAGCILYNTEQLGRDASPWSTQMCALANQHMI